MTMMSGKRLPGGFSSGAMGEGARDLLQRKHRREDLQADVGGEQEDDVGGGEPQVSGVRAVVAAREPVGEGPDEECDSRHDERVAEGSHGLRVEVEEGAEGGGVVGGVWLKGGGGGGVGGGG